MTTEHLDRPCPSRSDRALIDLVPAPIWIEDWTEIESYCARQKALGVTDLRSILEGDEASLRDVVSRINVTAVNDLTVDFVGADSSERLLGTLPGDLLNGGALRSLIDQIMVVWNTESAITLVINGVDMGGADLEFQLDWAAPMIGDKPDYSRVVVLLRDVSVQRAEERLMRKNVSQLEILLDMSRGVASTFDIDMILQLLAATAVELLGADEALLLLVDTKNQELTHVVGEGYPAAEMRNHTYGEVMAGMSGQAIETRDGILCADIATDPRNEGKAKERATRYAGTSVAIAPIISDDLVLGTLTTLNGADSPEFTEMDLALVKMLAAQAAVAIRNAEIYQELRANRDRVHEAHEELKNTQTQLLGAQKMEAIGGLAAGIAHEINTPIQFVSDNVSFIKDSAIALAGFGQAHIAILDQLVDHPELGQQIRDLRQQWKDADCDFLLEELPDAIEETLEGATRVADIVKAMKEFAHPGQEDLTPSNINRIIETTVQVSRNEWKYVADVELDLDETLPMVPALPGPLGQSLLIIIVNAAQAMDGKVEGKGRIKISSRHLGEIVEIRVSDNGPGIPSDIIGRIFEPFFTTKEIGKGSGQGLSIAHSVIVDKHHGRIWAENTDPGATFVLHLPSEETTKKSDS